MSTKRWIRLKEWGANVNRIFTPNTDNLEKSDKTLIAKDYVLKTDQNGFIISSSTINYQKKIYLFGDSFVESLYNDDEDRFSALLQKLLNTSGFDFECLNGGYSGSTTLHILNSVINKVEKNSTVILIIPSNDTIALSQENTYWNLSNKRLTPIVPEDNLKVVKSLFNSNLEDFDNLLITIFNYCSLYNITLLLTTIPYRNVRYSASEYLQKRFVEEKYYLNIINKYKILNARSKKIALEYNIPILNLDIILAEDEKYFYDDLHLNMFGSKIVSELIFKFLIDNSILDQNEKTKNKPSLSESKIKNGVIFKNHLSYVQIPKIIFTKDDSWTINIVFKEYENNGRYNFFFGEKGGIKNSFVRVENKIYYRAQDGSYVGGINYIKGETLNLFVFYNNGLFTFMTEDQKIVVSHATSVNFNVIGSGYNGKEFEEKTLISKLQIWNTAIDLENKDLFKEDISLQHNEYLIADWHFDTGFGCILHDYSGQHNHGILKNTEWMGQRSNILLKSQEPLALVDWKVYLEDSYKTKIDFDFNKIGKKDIFTTEMFSPLIRNKTKEKGNMLLQNIFSFKNFNNIEFSEVIQWDSFDKEDRNWQWQLHQWIFIGDLISAHSITQDKIYLDKLFFIIDSWCEYYYNINVYKSMAWQDHATALRLRNMLYIWEYVQDIELDVTVKENFLTSLELHANILSSNSFYSQHNNHGFDQSFILYWTALKFPEFTSSESWKNIAYDRLLDEIGVSFTSEGVHVENSSAYQIHMLQRLMQVSKLFDSFNISNKINLNILIENSFNFLLYSIQPNGNIPLLGDTRSDEKLPSFSLLSHLENYPLYQFIQSKGKTGKLLDASRCKVYPESGYAIFRDQWFSEKGSIQLILKNTFLSTYHRHDDDLNFILQGLGEEWFVDGGLYKYDEQNQYRRYLRSAKAHNIPVIVNAEVSRLISEDVDKQSKITDYFLSEETSWVEAKSFMYTGYCVTRKIEYIRPNRFIITDKVDADSEETTPYELMFHIPMDKKIELRDDNSIYISSQNTHELHMLFDGECSYSFELLSGEDDKEVIGWQSKVFGKIDPIQTLRCSVVPKHNKAYSIVEMTFRK